MVCAFCGERFVGEDALGVDVACASCVDVGERDEGLVLAVATEDAPGEDDLATAGLLSPALPFLSL